jgi:tRNA A37 methylthiotransferase MiaB
VEAYGRLPKLCQSAHVPVQSGSDRILKAMHRGYTRARYLDIIRQLRRVQPAIGLTTDIIVGFPGETEEDFAETLSLVREAQFDNAYLFKYSPRRDTPAAEMPDQAPTKSKNSATRACWRKSTPSGGGVTRSRWAERWKFWWKGRAKTKSYLTPAADGPHALQQNRFI